MNKFFKQPMQEDIQVISDYFTKNAEYHITLGQEDFEQILKDSENVTVLECLESGEGRLPRAVNTIVKTFESIAPDRDIYSANRFLLQISYSDAEPLLINETLAITDFISKLPSDTDVIWGVAKENISLPYTISLKLIAASTNATNNSETN